ncbi:MAG: hypothetical protein COA63_003110 [Methylophaga sp.]|nr:hypothetical protein [Methylophaga sp.]
MATNCFTLSSFVVRLVFALVLVYASYNPSGYSLFHWAEKALFGEALLVTPPFAMAIVILLIGWTVYIRATVRSLGTLGLFLVAAFFGVIIWWLIDLGWIGVDSLSVITYILLFLLATILATGMSWSHIRRKMSGQIDVDEVDE